LSFFRRARVLLVTGKGGTGKTTVSAVLANLAARSGMHAMVVQIGAPTVRRAEEDAWPPPLTGHLPGLFGSAAAIGYEPVALPTPASVSGQVSARALAPDTALVEYLNQHGMRRLSRRLVASGALDVVATAVPGMPDMLVLGKVKQIERASAAGLGEAPDLIVLDAPAAGHAVRFLEGPSAILQAAASGPIRSQAQEVVDMLSDPSRCQVLLVTTAEETPVSETVETAQLLASRTGTNVSGVVVNARLPVAQLPDAASAADLAALAGALAPPLADEEVGALLAAGDLRRQRQASQTTQVERLAATLPVPQLELPFCFSSDMGPAQLEALTDAMAASVKAFRPLPS
jgi:anion-transporting  ArsA/GET3 family ATPase